MDHGLIAIRPTDAQPTRQGLPAFVGVCGANTGATGICMNLVEIPPGHPIRAGTRISLLANSIVIIAPKDSNATVNMGPRLDLAPALGSGRIAMGNVDAVPAGKYGKAALEKLGAWEGIKDRIAQADSVRAALLLVSRGEAPLGIVYATDARASGKVRVVGIFPPGSHPPIRYPLALLRSGTSPGAEPFRRFLLSREGQASFARRGFLVR